MGIIFDLYYGKMQPFCERENSSSEYCEKIEKLLEIEGKLEKQYPDMMQILNEYKKINADINDIIAYEQFLKGYRFGAEMIIAAIGV